MDRETLITRIYEASMFPSMWPQVLEEFGQTIATPGSVLLIRRSDAWVGSALSPSMEVPTLQYLKSGIPARSKTTDWLIACDHPGFLRGEDVATRDEWERDPFHAEWACNWGLNFAIATAIRPPNGDTLVFHLQRKNGEPTFSKREVSILDSFRPHLARAGLLAARWRLQQLRAAAEALAMVGLPAAILDLRGRVLVANTLIQAMKSQVNWLVGDRIALVDRKSNELLNQAITGLVDPSRSVRSFPARSAGGDAVVVHLMPTPGRARDLFNGGLGLLVLTPVTRAAAPDATLIRALFDLTPAEARVARELANGDSVDQIAARAAVSISTIRTQVQAVLSKTGMSRQAQVAALFAGLPQIPVT